jgi:SOS-response transcriptional repressor LexA
MSEDMERRSDRVAVEICDKSMMPDYAPGDICIVDRDRVAADGDDVIVSDRRGRICLRRYISRASNAKGDSIFDLSTPNDEYPTLFVRPNIGVRILGVVVERRRRLCLEAKMHICAA